MEENIITDIPDNTEIYLESINDHTYSSLMTLNAMNDNLKSIGFISCFLVLTIFLYLFFHFTTNRKEV